MKNSLARAFLQVLALLTGLAAATVWRDRHNVLLNYPELHSTKAELALGVNGAQSFLRTPVTLANGALNLGAWFGHQELRLARAWQELPSVTLRARARGMSELNVGFRAGARTLYLRLSNKASRPSGWYIADEAGIYVESGPLAYSLPEGRWISVSVRASAKGLEPLVDGKPLPGRAFAPGPVQLVLRGDSAGGVLQVDDLRVASGEALYEQSFAGEMPWALFLAVTVATSLLFLILEKAFSPRSAAVFAGSAFLVLCAGMALYRGKLSARYPVKVDLSGVPSRIETRDEAFARLRALPPGKKPVLLWLGGSQAWGAGASRGDRTAFARLQARLGDGRLEWVNGAISGATLHDQREALAAVKKSRRVALVVLTAGVNDAANPRFLEQLASFVAEVRASGARLVLVPEPTETPGAWRAPMRELAAREHVTCISVQPELDRNADHAFYWWDFVHLTDAGADLVARALEGPLRAELK